MKIHDTTELASGFTVKDYKNVRALLHANDVEAWTLVLGMLRRRVSERVLKPVDALAQHDHEEPMPFRPGFAIVALDCLLIDTIQSFREGRNATGESSTAASFKKFLAAEPFTAFTSDDRKDFYSYVRNGLLHNGETRHDWKVRRGNGAPLLVKDRERGRTLNRIPFHAAVAGKFEDLCRDLEGGRGRQEFLGRMDAICGLRVPSQLYFAYGSNLDRATMNRVAPGAKDIGIGFLPRARVAFLKHSTTWGSDAATLVDDPMSVAWGFIYEVPPGDMDALTAKEVGYSTCETAVFRADDEGVVSTLKATTFRAAVLCADQHGPSAAYRNAVVRGARQRQLPEEYCRHLEVVAL